ncbi:hypothetical protein AAFF_G00284410 [Aldrovandia affinis]|uniref:Uncharacterized protein n=1 Tax=Aldrovandia affinis TaxID=143900 RepID=A0AAD7TA63_9TELE|nr:hypothetical protein AAFF_G00284410 [Aldrovandia affinis]
MTASARFPRRTLFWGSQEDAGCLERLLRDCEVPLPPVSEDMPVGPVQDLGVSVGRPALEPPPGGGKARRRRRSGAQAPAGDAAQPERAYLLQCHRKRVAGTAAISWLRRAQMGRIRKAPQASRLPHLENFHSRAEVSAARQLSHREPSPSLHFSGHSTPAPCSPQPPTQPPFTEIHGQLSTTNVSAWVPPFPNFASFFIVIAPTSENQTL